MIMPELKKTNIKCYDYTSNWAPSHTKWSF